MAPHTAPRMPVADCLRACATRQWAVVSWGLWASQKDRGSRRHWEAEELLAHGTLRNALQAVV